MSEGGFVETWFRLSRFTDPFLILDLDIKGEFAPSQSIIALDLLREGSFECLFACVRQCYQFASLDFVRLRSVRQSGVLLLIM